MGVPDGVLIGTIVKPNVGLVEDEFRSVVRELARASIDLIKDDELMTDPAYLPWRPASAWRCRRSSTPSRSPATGPCTPSTSPAISPASSAVTTSWSRRAGTA
jgi:hypothetical protein